MENFNLDRFVAAQNANDSYQTALSEVKNGMKTSHWMWYIFPQFQWLGRSYMSQMYSIKSLEEAQAYLNHEVLGRRLYEITNAMPIPGDAERIFGYVDAKKLRSCLTLFDIVSPNDVFAKYLSAYFNGKRCGHTISYTKMRNFKTLQEAIKARHSVRAYKDIPLTADVVKMLRDSIAALNREGGLHIQLITDEPKAFSGTIAKYGKFRGVSNYLVMAGKKAADLDERVGYYGEQLVLMAQAIGLNTCWVGVSYSKIPGTYVLSDDEKIACYIAIGYGETNGSDHKVKSVEQVSNASNSTPSWFRKGVEAALLAPTAVNQQKFSFKYVKGDTIDGVQYAKGFSLIGYTKIDLGIAKCHFEIGADRENFRWIQG